MLYHIQKCDLKWIINLDVKDEHIKTSGRKYRRKVFDLSLDKYFLDRKEKAHTVKEIDFIKI